MWWIDGRIAWPLFFAALYSTFAVLAIDFVWRSVQASVLLLGVAAIALLLAGNAAIFILGARSR